MAQELDHFSTEGFDIILQTIIKQLNFTLQRIKNTNPTLNLLNSHILVYLLIISNKPDFRKQLVVYLVKHCNCASSNIYLSCSFSAVKAIHAFVKKFTLTSTLSSLFYGHTSAAMSIMSTRRHPRSIKEYTDMRCLHSMFSTIGSL